MTLDIIKHNKRLFLFLLFIIAISIFLLPLYQHITVSHDKKNNSYFDNELFKSGKRSFSSLKGLSFTEKIDNKPSFQIKAKKAYIRNRKVGFFRVAFQKVSEMKDVTISFFKNNREVTSISSDYAIFYLGTNHILFNGKVKCSTESGRTLKTEKLFWDNKKKILNAKENYIYTSPDGFIKEGKGFKSDNKLIEINIDPERKTMVDRRSF